MKKYLVSREDSCKALFVTNINPTKTDGYSDDQVGMLGHEKASTTQIYKGGDGGSLICGGTGMAIGYLPAATYYRQSYMGESLKAAYKNDIGGDHIY